VIAEGTGIGGITGIGAVGSGDHSLVVMTQGRSFVTYIAVATAGTGVGGMTAVGAIRGSDLGLVAMSQSSSCIALIAVAANLAGVKGVAAIGTVRDKGDSLVVVTFHSQGNRNCQRSVQLLTVDATFNAVEFETEEFDKVTRRSAGFNAEDEMNKTIEEGGLDREPDAAGSMEDIQKRLKQFEEAAAKLAGKFEQDSVGYDKNLPTHALDLGENTTFVTRGKDGSKVVMSVVDTKVVTAGGKDRKVQFLDGSNYDQSKLKPQHTTTWVFHMQGAYQADLGTTLKNESTEGVFATSDREGNWAANLDQAYKSNTAANSRGEAFQSYAAIELPGAVALYKGDNGKYYERVSTGVKGVEYREISEAKFNEVAGDEYTKASMEGNKNLEDSYSKAINNEKSAVAADGSVVKVKFTNVYDNKVTEEELYKMESLGRAMATRDEFNYTEEELSNMKAVSHGMLDSSSGKLEGLPSRNRKLLDAFIKGLRR
jgi:hypothetical protein